METIAFFAPETKARMVFSDAIMKKLSSSANIKNAIFTKNHSETIHLLHDADIIVSTWGMCRIDSEFLAKTPRLKAVCYAAGSVKHFTTPEMWEKDIVLSSSAIANAIPVAEYALAHILLANKGFWKHIRNVPHDIPAYGNFKRTAGIIGASLVGRELIRLLKSTDLEILVADPFLNAEEAMRLGVEKVELDELMRRSDVVSLHAPNLAHLRHMINNEMFSLMRDGATFINTARGGLVDEQALIEHARSGRIWAILDVTDPEPPVPESPLRHIPNIILTPHIAGSISEECLRMGQFAVDEAERFMKGLPLLNRISRDMLDRIA